MKQKKALALALTASMALSGCGSTAASGSRMTAAETAAAEETAAASTEAADEAATEASTEAAAEAPAEEETQAPEEEASNAPVQLTCRSTWDGIDNDNGMLVDASYDQLALDGTSYESILAGSSAGAADPISSDTLQSALSALNEEVKTSHESEVKDMQEMAENDPDAQSSEYGEAVYLLNEKLYVQRADATVLSVLQTSESYTHGAHGWTGLIGHNYSTVTGKALSLSDCFTDTGDLPQMIADRIIEQNAAAAEEDSPEDTLTLLTDMINEPESILAFTLGPTCVTFWLSSGAIYSYAAGAVTASFTYEELSDILKPELVPDTKDGSIVSLPEAVPVSFPDGDGGFTSLTVISWPNTDSEGYDTGEQTISVAWNGTSAENTVIGYRTDFCFVDTGENQYLLLNCLEENDWEAVHIYDPGTQSLQDPDDSSFGFYEAVPLDPDRMVLASRAQILGTIQTKGLFSLDDDGALKELYPGWYTASAYNEDNAITTKKDMTVQAGQDDGAAPDDLVTKETELPSGTLLHYLRTNGTDTTDLTAKDGAIVRLKLDDPEDYPKTIDGTDIETLFDGILFAG